MQQSDETRFEDFVGLISGLYKEIQRIKTSEGARLGLKGSDVMCLYYLERSKDGLTGADLARMAGVTRAAVSRTLAHLEEGGYVEVEGKRAIGIPIKLSRTPGQALSAPPRFGQHTRALLAEYGFDAAAIDALLAQGTVMDGSPAA